MPYPKMIRFLEKSRFITSAGRLDEATVLRTGYLSYAGNALLAPNGDDFASTAGIPLKLKKQLGELKLDLQTVATMLSTMVATIALAKDSGQPQPSPPTPVLPNPVPPTPVLPKASPPIPFEKIGKRSIEVLYADYVQAPLHAEVQCRFKLGNHSFPAKLGNPSFPTILTKIQSVPEVSLTLKHKQLWGNGVKGGLCFVLPFGTSSLAKIQYLNERACLNASLGLHVNPPIKISGMYGSNGICGGGSFTFNAQNGGLTGLDVGVCLSNPEWGIFSASAKMLKGPEGAHGRALRVLYSQDVMKNKTIAADVAYNYEDSTVVVTAGVEHRVDDLMLIKGRFSSDGTVACMVQFKEGLAGSTFRAMVQTNVGSLQLPPRVGFSITTDPTK